jgi:DNA-binding response OmpR family regulator
VVDDDSAILTTVAQILQPWGYRVVTLDKPQAFWEMLEATVPNALILDIEMPCYSGLELCQAVRQDPRWANLPILFLSAHRDQDSICQVFLAGGDDYINKPIVEAELIARLLNRLERSRARAT